MCVPSGGHGCRVVASRSALMARRSGATIWRMAEAGADLIGVGLTGGALLAGEVGMVMAPVRSRLVVMVEELSVSCWVMVVLAAAREVATEEELEVAWPAAAVAPAREDRFLRRWLRSLSEYGSSAPRLAEPRRSGRRVGCGTSFFCAAI